MDKSTLNARARLGRLALLPVLLLGLAAAAFAQDEADPPGRVAALTHETGSVVFAPAGEDEWLDLPLNRPLTRGDRVWTDAGARAELHMGTATIHLDSRSHLAFYELNDQSAQLSITQGTMNVHVRELAPRENMEIDTPNLAVRALEPGDVRVDVDPVNRTTHVAVHSGAVQVFGQGGESVQLEGGQDASFEGRDLARIPARFGPDDFDRWAGDLNRREDQSVSARYIPADTVGVYELDNYGTWSSDAQYGNVWYPSVSDPDWAPYRDGHWAWIAPWGWTWVDAQPWGFAPFHYGRWAIIGTRWAWVPGSLGPRPWYAPALVGFVGGGLSFQIGSGAGIGWYPLAPGEAWYPTYRTSRVYVTRVNRNFRVDGRRNGEHFFFRHHPEAVTAMRVDDFNHGRPVHEHFSRVRPEQLTRLAPTTVLPKPDRSATAGPSRRQRLVANPAATGESVTPFGRRELRGDRRTETRPEGRVETRPGATQRSFVRPEDNGAAERQREQERAQREQQRTQAERAAREQQQQRMQAERAAREQQQQRMQAERAARDQQQQRMQAERAAREQQQQRMEAERAARDQQQQRMQAERAMREQAMREQQQRQAAERAAREAAVRQQQESRAAQREQMIQQQQQMRAQRQQEAQAERAQRREQRNDDDEQRGRRRD
jgi:hypothetical protein